MINCTFEDGGKASLRHVVVDNIVINSEKVLLVKRAKELLEGGKWGLPAGFVERDETLKQAARREIQEETGWIVSDLTLFRIKDGPDRPHEDRQNISVVFISNADKKISEKDDESDEVRWFAFDNLPNEIAFDHGDDILLYKEYLNHKFTLPLSLE